MADVYSTGLILHSARKGQGRKKGFTLLTGLRAAFEQASAIRSRHGLRGLAARAGLRLVRPAGASAAEWKGALVQLDLAGDAGAEAGEQETGRVAAVFVTFHPDEDFAGRLAATLEQVDHVYVVDNTPDGARLPSGPFEVICNRRNLGIATALNQGAQRSGSDGYRYVLMMDQDSAPRPGMVADLRAALRRWPTPAAIASPRHLEPDLPQSDIPTAAQGEARSMLATMTAGSLLDLRAYAVLGPFRDDLFIDQVDHEYCLRAHRGGYDVIQVEGALVEHKLGERSVHEVAGLSVATSNHSPLRRYYITRNRLTVARDNPDFPAYRRVARAQTRRELCDALLFEDQRLAKLRMAARGLWHYWRRRTGPLREWKGSPPKNQSGL